MSTYIPLKEKIKPYLETKFNDLPEPIKSCIKEVDDHELWDKVLIDYLMLSRDEANKERIAELEQVFLDRRMVLIDKYDLLNDPSREHERRQYGSLEDQYFALELLNIRNEWDYWARRLELLADEAIPLMHGVDPRSWQEYIRGEKGLHDDMIQFIERSLKFADIEGIKKASPSKWLDWGREHKLNEHTLKPDYIMNVGEVCLWRLFEDAVEKALTDTLHAKPITKSFDKKYEDPTRWEYTARKIGQEYFEENKEKGVDDIAKHVEGEMSNRNILGVRGKFLDWQTIKREALTGVTKRKPNGRK